MQSDGNLTPFFSLSWLFSLTHYIFFNWVTRQNVYVHMNVQTSFPLLVFYTPAKKKINNLIISKLKHNLHLFCEK